MFRPQIQKTRILGYLAIINMFLVYWALNSYTETPTFGYEIKKKSEKYMNNQINFLRDLYSESLINSGKDSFSYADFLIGPRESEIRTTKGSKLSKQITLSPRFSAMITEMLMELNIDSTDLVAISYTGSYPGANIAVLSALEAMHIKAAIIGSCGSSEFGATNPGMTWLDIENKLYKEKYISNKSSFATIGGGLDKGTQMSTEGKNICIQSIYKNNLNYLDTSIPNRNIDNRIKYYDNAKGKGEIKLFINIGGGIYAVGDSIERNLVPPGIIYPGDIDSRKGQTVVYEFLNRNIPVININHIHALANWYDLESPPKKKFEATKGSLFYSKKQYNAYTIIIAFLISACSVLAIGIISHREIKKRMYASEPESIV